MSATSSVKKRRIYTILMILCIIGFWLFENFYTPASYSDFSNLGSKTEMPLDLLPASTTGAFVEQQHYVLSYNEPFEQAEWVAYVLKREHLTDDDRKRPYFIEDPKVPTKSADWKNYRGSGYDRGHLCPAGDRRFSEQAYNETFYTSNISPQVNDFNAGVWNRLEMKVRQWAKRYGTVFVFTGGVLESGLPEIGDEDVDVPQYYYKIVAKGDIDKLEVIGFLMAAKESTQRLQKFMVTVDEIENRTGIDFFERLPEQVEAKVESTVVTDEWQF